jgi:Flp pilus assembly CpaE family ATPase
LYKILKNFRIPNKLLNLIKITLQDSNGKMEIQVQLAEALGIERRLRQGLSTALFIVALEKVIRNIETNPTGIISTE